MLPLGDELAGVEVGVRIEPEHAQFLAGFAAVARHRADRADAEAVIAAEQDRQPARGRARRARRRAPAGSSRPPRRGGDSHRPAAARDSAGRSDCRDRAPRGRGSRAPRPMPGDPQCLGAHATRRGLPAPISVGAPIREIRRFVSPRFVMRALHAASRSQPDAALRRAWRRTGPSDRRDRARGRCWRASSCAGLQQRVQVAQRREIFEREADRIEDRHVRRSPSGPRATPRTICSNSVTAESAGICWISPSMRDCGFVLDDDARIGRAQDVARAVRSCRGNRRRPR